MAPDGESPEILAAFEGIDLRRLRAGLLFLEGLGILPDITLKPDLVDPSALRTLREDTASKERGQCTVTASVKVEGRAIQSDQDGRPCITPEYKTTVEVVEECRRPGGGTDRKVLKRTVTTHRAAPVCAQPGQPRPPLPSQQPTVTDTTESADGQPDRRIETLRYPHGTTVKLTSDGTRITVVITLPDGTTIEVASG